MNADELHREAARWAAELRAWRAWGVPLDAAIWIDEGPGWARAVLRCVACGAAADVCRAGDPAHIVGRALAALKKLGCGHADAVFWSVWGREAGLPEARPPDDVAAIARLELLAG